jgi:hypothetical protein
MEKVEQEKLALALLDMVNKKRDEIKTLTSEIMELESDPKNIVRIKQKVQSILNAVASFSSDSNGLMIVKLNAELVFKAIRLSTDEDDQTVHPCSWHGFVVHELEDFCLSANSWNPIKSDFAKGSKITINFPKTLNIASIVNYLKGKS